VERKSDDDEEDGGHHEDGLRDELSGHNFLKTFSSTQTLGHDKLECLSLGGF
jgi:hypothetical protein